MKWTLLGAGLLALFLILSSSGYPERGLGPAFTHITLIFVSGDIPQAGVHAILKDGANREHTGISDSRGMISFTLQAETAMAFVTYWKEESPVWKKTIEYDAGNNYTIRLEIPE
jgi:hypothetical protein